MDSSTIRIELKKSLRSIQLFIIFGMVVILLFLAFIPLIEAKNSPQLGMLAVRIPLYGLLLPYLIWYYLYRPIVDVRRIDRFFTEVECGDINCIGTLISSKIVTAHENGTAQIVILAGVKYDCRIYTDNDKEYYYPTAILKKGFKLS
jgi:hypothetical protein